MVIVIYLKIRMRISKKEFIEKKNLQNVNYNLRKLNETRYLTE